MQYHGNDLTEFVGNEIELGMVMPKIGSRTNQVSRSRRNRTRRLKVQAMMNFVEYLGVIMGVLIPLLIIDRRGVSVMSTYSRTVGWHT